MLGGVAMGHSISVKCCNCKYSKTIKLGIGMAFSPKRINDIDPKLGILPSLIRSKDELRYIKTLLTEKNGIIPYCYEYKMYHCPKCSEFYERFYFTVDHDEGTYEPNYKCSKCRIKLDVIESSEDKNQFKLSKYQCPKCGKYELIEGDEFLLWD